MEELRKQGTFESEEESRTRFVGLPFAFGSHVHGVLTEPTIHSSRLTFLYLWRDLIP